ncbi:Mov34/MPN/PAD-1 family protein [Corallococcus llansteffanensis]|uniref:M67 family peptidase n=1 Tax=Corallococcus llansteffanensis TaxID=2316731 RepID=A0A3A8PWW1_9BACT|nr:M67 family metallopeptidase [Corallococcus llansteffanensis]RKH56862.1 M67 family peptidase [Corallococcus llansteffanensis]
MLALRGGGPEALSREIPPEVLARVMRHLEGTWPREGCGVILQARAGEEDPWRVLPLPNVSPTPRVAYAFAPEAWLQVCREAEARQEAVVCVFHSHVDTAAVFSAEDRLQAAPEGIPLLPGVSYLVVAIQDGRVTSASTSEWKQGDFQTVPIPASDFRFEKAL